MCMCIYVTACLDLKRSFESSEPVTLTHAVLNIKFGNLLY